MIPDCVPMNGMTAESLHTALQHNGMEKRENRHQVFHSLKEEGPEYEVKRKGEQEPKFLLFTYEESQGFTSRIPLLFSLLIRLAFILLPFLFQIVLWH